jgi:hypothetical protein
MQSAGAMKFLRPAQPGIKQELEWWNFLTGISILSSRRTHCTPRSILSRRSEKGLVRNVNLLRLPELLGIA